MKNIVIALILITSLSCKAQSPIIAITDKTQPNITNAYYKDINNIMDDFVGTWSYVNGNTNFTIELKKVEAYYNNTYYRDRLVGEYKYIDNGVEVVNYLPRLVDPSINNAQRSIKGSRTVRSRAWLPSCADCLPSEWLFSLYFRDFSRRYLNSIIVLRYKNDNGTEKLQIRIGDGDSAMLPSADSPTETRVPYGTYELIKQ